MGVYVHVCSEYMCVGMHVHTHCDHQRMKNVTMSLSTLLKALRPGLSLNLEEPSDCFEHLHSVGVTSAHSYTQLCIWILGV